MSVLTREQLPQVDIDSEFATIIAPFDNNTNLQFASLVIECIALDKTNAFLRNLGSVAVVAELDLIRDEKPITSLYDAVKRAHFEQDPTAIEMTKTNVRTDVIERTLKSGHIIEVELDENEQGQIVQYGQTNEQIQANTFRFANENPILKPRTNAEARNVFRLQTTLDAGLLDDYYFFVPSLCAIEASDDQLNELGFFAPTKSMALQLTTRKNGKIVTESAFVAGVKKQGAPRHDSMVIEKLGEELGADWQGKTDAEIIDRPMLIHKKLLPNGVIDLVKMIDDINGGTFFGEDKPRQDYIAYRQVCRNRERDLAPTVENITAELIRTAPTLSSELEACQLLHKISERHTVKLAVEDVRIDARVFGVLAVPLIEDARKAYALGDLQRTKVLTSDAQLVARSSSCPSGASKQGSTSGILFESLISSGQSVMAEGLSDKKEAEQDSMGSLEFLCPNNHVNTRPRNQTIPVCKTCGVSVRCDTGSGKEKTRKDTNSPQKQLIESLSKIFGTYQQSETKAHKADVRPSKTEFALAA